MKCAKFKDEEKQALNVLAFKIEDDNETATTEGCQITILRPFGSNNYHITITLPSGDELHASLRSEALTEAAGIDA
jgi:hypothetical protein